jgi:hypothetical protein
MPEFAPVIVVSSLNAQKGFRLDGEAAVDQAARAVVGGDVNGDGFSDLLIGAGYASFGGDTRRGLAYVVFGASTTPAAQTLTARVAAGTAYRFEGADAFHYAGFSISNAGDVNGDGIDDILIGAKGASYDSIGNIRGATFLVFGGMANFEALDNADTVNDNRIALANLTAAAGYRFDGVADGDQSGLSVSSAGDVNGDGIADLLIGAYTDTNGSDSGSTYLVFGGANLAVLDGDDGAVDGQIDLSQISLGQGMRIDGLAGDRSGISVASAGDINGDGFDDIIVGAPLADPNGVANDEGAAYVIFGRPTASFWADLQPDDLNGVNGVRLDGIAPDDATGSVSGLGDINGDGFSDVIVGAMFASSGDYHAGAAYVVFGKSTWSSSFDLASLNGSNGFRLDGLHRGAQAGISVSAAGDINGDGFGDLVVSAVQFSRIDAYNAGAAFVVFGGASGFSPIIDLGALDGNDGFRIDGAATDDQLGGRVAAAGDVNGDGFDDIIVGARAADNNGNASGSAYIVYGHRAQSDVTRLGTSFDDRINGGTGDDLVKGFGGNDTLLGWEGDDTVWGGSGKDQVIAAAGDDELHGGSGRDTLIREVQRPDHRQSRDGQLHVAQWRYSNLPFFRECPRR